MENSQTPETEFAPAFKATPKVRAFRGNHTGLGTSVGAGQVSFRGSIEKFLSQEEEADALAEAMYYGRELHQDTYVDKQENDFDDTDADDDIDVEDFITCPHCTTEMVIEEIGDGVHQVSCHCCGVSGPRATTERRALAYANILFENL